MVASPGFDASVWELWPYLTSGASVHAADLQTVAQTGTLADWLSREQITHSFLPTPIAESLLDSPDAERVSLEVLLTGGDRLRNAPDRSLPFVLVNHYGPTEAAVVATYARVAGGASGSPPPIGRPMPNEQVYVLDSRSNLVPIGVAGELNISGIGLARGYLDHPDLTAEKFVPDPFGAPGGRLYRTGDLTRTLQNGELDYLGRIDDQVKVRGLRIELGEIETLLVQHELIEAAAVAIHQDESGDKKLVAYLSPKTGAAPEIKKIKEFLRSRLPEHMVPAIWMTIGHIPLTRNGKTDRRALPAPDPARSNAEGPFTPPRTSVEAALADLWKDLLGVSRVGIEESFFDLGGHSVLAAQMVSRLRDLFMIDLTVRVVFERPTIQMLAEVIESSPAGNSLQTSRIIRAPRERFRLDPSSGQLLPGTPEL
jgi:acyl-coenzyme A synthetase/AMP-(fatty) acid ligase